MKKSRLTLSIFLLIGITLSVSASGGIDSLRNQLLYNNTWLTIASDNPDYQKATSNGRSNTRIYEGAVINFTGNEVVWVKKTITNSTDSALEVYFNHLPENDSAFLMQYLLSKCTNLANIELTKWEVVYAVADFLKSDRFVNDQIIYTSSWNDSVLWGREMNFVNFLYSTYSSQCGNYANHAETICMWFSKQFGGIYFQESDFKTVTVPGHSLGMIRLYGYLTLCDFDPGEPFFMIPFSGSPNGFASIDDVRNNPLLIDSAPRYTYNGKELTKVTNATYKQLLTGSTVTVGDFPFYHCFSGSGKFIFPPKSTFTVTSQGWILFLDVVDTSSVNKLMYVMSAGWYQMYQQGTCASCIDSIRNTFRDIWEISFVDIDQILGGARTVVLYNSVDDQGKDFAEVFRYKYSRDSLSVLKGSLSGRTRTYVAGVDYQFPLYLFGTNDSMCVDDTCFANASFNLFDSGNTAPNVEENQVHYLQEGTMSPSVSGLVLSINANTGILSPLDTWELRGSTDSLEIVTEVSFVPKEVTVAIPEVINDQMRWIYPNPMSNKVYSLYDNLELYNSLGQKCSILKRGENDVSFLAPGFYFTQFGPIIKK